MGANAQTSVPAFTSGQVLTAAQVTGINTGIPVFASSTERDAAFGGTGEKTLAEGQMAYLEDTNVTQVYDGSSWMEIAGGTYTDFSGTISLSNVTIGNGTLWTQYCQIGDFVHWVGAFTLGSTSSITGTVDSTIPVSADSGQGVFLTGTGTASDGGVNVYTLAPQINTSADSVRFRVQRISATFLRWDSVNATQPFSWTTGDVLTWNFTYKAA